MGKIKGSGLLVCDRQSRYTPAGLHRRFCCLWLLGYTKSFSVARVGLCDWLFVCTSKVVMHPLDYT